MGLEAGGDGGSGRENRLLVPELGFQAAMDALRAASACFGGTSSTILVSWAVSSEQTFSALRGRIPRQTLFVDASAPFTLTPATSYSLDVLHQLHLSLGALDTCLLYLAEM